MATLWEQFHHLTLKPRVREEQGMCVKPVSTWVVSLDGFWIDHLWIHSGLQVGLLLLHSGDWVEGEEKQASQEQSLCDGCESWWEYALPTTCAQKDGQVTTEARAVGRGRLQAERLEWLAASRCPSSSGYVCMLGPVVMNWCLCTPTSDNCHLPGWSRVTVSLTAPLCHCPMAPACRLEQAYRRTPTLALLCGSGGYKGPRVELPHFFTLG